MGTVSSGTSELPRIVKKRKKELDSLIRKFLDGDYPLIDLKELYARYEDLLQAYHIKEEPTGKGH